MESIRRAFLTRPLFYIFIGVFSVTLLACRIISAGAELTAKKFSFKGAGEVYKDSWNNGDCMIFKGRSGKENIKILINMQQVDEGYVKELLKSGFVYIDGEISEPEKARNFGEFDYENYIKSRGINYVGYFGEENITVREKSEGERHSPAFYAAALRSDIFECLEKYFGEEYSGWVMSVMTGDTGYLEREEKESLSFAGFSHLVAVSGAHITFFAFPFELLLKRFTLLDAPKKKLLLLLPMVFLWYTAGGSPSVTRAVIMSAYSAAAVCLRRHYDAANALGFSGVCQIAVNPYSVYNTGFLLSYGAVICIIFILPRVKKYIKTESKILDSLLTGISVNAGLFPLVLYLFNGFSIIGMAASAAVSYAANFLCIGGYAVYGAEKAGVSEKIIGMLSKGILGATEIFKGITEKIASGNGFLSRFEAVSPSAAFFVIYYLVMIVLVSGKKSYRLVAAVLPVLLVFGICGAGCFRGEVTVFDVGQGSAALIETCDGFFGLVDTGDGSVALEKLLLKEGVKKLDFLVLSHGHDDHYGGIDGVLENMEVERVFVPSNVWDSYCNELTEKCRAKGIETVAVDGKAAYKIGRYSVLELYESKTDEKNLNNGSVIVRFGGDWGSMLFPGDAENEALERYTREGVIGKVDVLCFPHHGGASSDSEKFLFSAAPEYVIISCGKDNQYGHPSESALESIEKIGVSEDHVFRTDEGGAVKMKIGRIPFVSKEFVFVWQKKMKLSQVFPI